jgi:DNA-directed RNA polymerase specialized sigma24 family protein
MSELQLKLINQKMDRLIRLVATSLTKDQPQAEQVFLLSKAGFQPKDIAEFIGTSPNAVRVCLSKLRRGRTKT